MMKREGGVGQEGGHGERERQAVYGLSFKRGKADEGIGRGRIQGLIHA